MGIVEEIRKCKLCDIKTHKPLVFGNPSKAKIVFISEEPTADARDKDFINYYLGKKDKRFHDEWMPKMGINEKWMKENIENENLYITHIFKCCSELKQNERDEICQKCLTWIEKEKELFQKTTIVAFGAYAFSAIMGVKRIGVTKKYFNEKQYYDRRENKVYFMFHPSWQNDMRIKKNSFLINTRLKEIKEAIRKAQELVKIEGSSTF